MSFENPENFAVENSEKSANMERPVFEPDRDFWDAIESRDENKINELKIQRLAEHPQETEKIETFFGLRDFMLKQLKLREEKKTGEYTTSKDIFNELTEYEYLFTHYVLNNDRSSLVKFWDAAKAVSYETGAPEEFDGFRRGILGQAAVYKILEEMGGRPRLSRPREDMVKKIDLWQTNDVALQVKEAKAVLEPEVLATENLAFPALEVKYKNESNFYNSKFYNESKRFRAKLRDYEKEIGRKIRGYVLIVPDQKIDPVTGEPSKELLEFYKKKL